MKAREHFEKVSFPYLEKIKVQNGYPEEQKLVIIMDTFIGQKCAKILVKLSLLLSQLNE